MRRGLFLFFFLFTAGSFAVPHVAHAGIPFFGPIIPSAQATCAGGWGLFVTVVNNIIELILTLAIVFVAPLMISYAGFLLVVNQGDPGKLNEAKGILVNTIVGIIVALSAWLIVAAIMAVLYNPTSSFGTWTSLLTSSGGASLCI